MKYAVVDSSMGDAMVLGWATGIRGAVRVAKKHLNHQRFDGTFRVELCTYVYLWEDYDDKEKRRVNKTRTAWVITDMEESL